MRKHFLFAMLLGAASCSSPVAKTEKPVVAKPPTRAEVEHSLISAKLKKGLGNPASYQAVSFMEDGQISKKDSVMLIGLTSETSNPAPYMKADSAKPAGRRYQHKFRAVTAEGGLALMDKTAVVYPNDSVLVFSF